MFVYGTSSCIIFAVMRSSSLFLNFHLHSLWLCNQLVYPQYLKDFFFLFSNNSCSIFVHSALLVLCLYLRLLFIFIFSLYPCHILMAFIIFGNSSSIIFAVVRNIFVAFALLFAYFEILSLVYITTVS